MFDVLNAALADLRRVTAPPPDAPLAPVPWEAVPRRWLAGVREVQAALRLPVAPTSIERDHWEGILASIEADARITGGFARGLALAERGPSSADLARAPRLASWAMALDGPRLVLAGRCADHPTVRPGWLRTSALLGLDPGRRWARTWSRWYRLGAPMEEGELAAFWASGVGAVIARVDEAGLQHHLGRLSEEVERVLAPLGLGGLQGGRA